MAWTKEIGPLTAPSEFSNFSPGKFDVAVVVDHGSSR